MQRCPEYPPDTQAARSTGGRRKLRSLESKAFGPEKKQIAHNRPMIREPTQSYNKVKKKLLDANKKRKQRCWHKIRIK